MKQDLTVGVVGAGRIALEHFGALQELGGLRVLACDRSAAAAGYAAERFGLAGAYTDLRELLARERPDVLHVTTPAPTHAAIATQALEADAHVLVEKPIAEAYTDWTRLRALAASRDRWIVEDYSYQFSPPLRRVRQWIDSGRFGAPVHVEVLLCLDIHAAESPFADPNAPHPSLSMPGGAISDFLTHLAYLGWLAVGRHQGLEAAWLRRHPASLSPYDELRALLWSERGTASLCFTANGGPDAFLVRVQGERMRAEANLFENTLRADRSWPGPSPFTPLLNGLRGGLSEMAGGVGSLWSKLSGRPGASEGVWQLVRDLYAALRAGGPPPVEVEEIDAVNCIVRDLLARRPDA